MLQIYIKITQKIWIIFLLFVICNVKLEEKLSYDFTLKNGSPELEVKKEDSLTSDIENKNNSSDDKKKTNEVKEDSDIEIKKEDMLKSNPSMAPILVLGDILKEFAKNMKGNNNNTNNKKLKKKKSKKRKDRKAVDVKKIKDRKAFDLGGDDELEQKLSLKETEQGLLIVMTTAESDSLRLLAATSMKAKGLIEKSRIVLKNSENSLNLLYESIDNICGNFEAMDKHFNRNFGGGGDAGGEEGKKKIIKRK